MKDQHTHFDDAELDRLLENQPITASDSFTNKVLESLKQDDDELLDDLLASHPIRLDGKFTQNTLERIHSEPSENRLMRHHGRWWMGMGGSVAAGLVAALVWMVQPDPLLPQNTKQEINIGEMQIEELFFVEENLSSAKVLIELDQNLPLLALIAESET